MIRAVLLAAAMLASSRPCRSPQTLRAPTTPRAFLPASSRPQALRSPSSRRTRAGNRHAKYFDDAWTESRRAPALASPQPGRPTTSTEHRPVMFYMFSGPDYLYADAFFPEASTYVLSGLEPVGQVPEVSQACRRTRSAADLRELQGSLNSVLSFSFFITKKMKTELTRRPPHRHAAAALRVPRPLRKNHPRRRARGLEARRHRRSLGRILSARATAPASRSCSLPRRRPHADALLLQHRSVRWRRQVERLPHLLRRARHRRQPRQERVLPHALGQLLQGARVSDLAQRRAGPGRLRHSRALPSKNDWDLGLSAITSARSLYSPAAIRRTCATSIRKGAPSPSISASAIATGRMNRTSCSPSGKTRPRRPRP